MKKKLTINPGCITCGACEFIAPQVFQVTDICHIRNNVAITEHAERIECAIQACPVQVIDYQESP
jgi:ferredoxin